jgi:integrase
MADTRNLEMRGRTYWAYITVPPSLRNIVGRRNLRRSLGTSDLGEAQRLRPLALAEFAQQLEQARKRARGDGDLIAERAMAWQRFAMSATLPDGEPISAETRADLLASQAENIVKDFGRQAAHRFEQLANTAALTALDRYLDAFQEQSQLKAKTKAEQRTAIRRLLAWDDTLKLESVDRRTAGRYIIEGLAFTNSPKTKNKHIGDLSAYWRYLLNRNLVFENPWRNQFVPLQRYEEDGSPKKTERPFTEAEIKTLLRADASPLLADAMRIAALSGMRREEICLLRVADCTGCVFSVTAGKTKAAVRQVPIHSALTDLVTARCAGKPAEAYLFHELGPAPTAGQLRGRGAPLTQKFERFRTKLGIEDKSSKDQRRSRVNFHSFRRWFISQAEKAGQPPWTIASLVGHKRSGMTLGVYSDGPSMEQRRACVEAVSLPV